MPVPKGTRIGGRQKGTPNKATLEKRAKAAAALAAEKNAPFEERELAKDALMRIARLAEGAAAVSRPTTESDIELGAKPNPDGNWERFHDWVRLTAWCYKAAADFQSPKMLGVAVAPAPQKPDGKPEIVRLRVFEGGQQVKMIERKTDAA